MNEQGFRWDAELYQNSSKWQFDLGMMAIERLAPIDGERILEIGCGNALTTIEIAKRIPNGFITAKIPDNTNKPTLFSLIHNCNRTFKRND